MIKVIIADDHAIVRKGLAQIIARTVDIKLSKETSSAEELLAAIGKDFYDAAVVDVSLPGRSGLDAASDIKRISPKTRILILSVHTDKQLVLEALRIGASGYIGKDSAPDELIGAIRKICNGEKYVSAEISANLLSSLSENAPEEPHESLSPREFQALKMIGSGKTVTEIADALNLSVKTVSTYRKRILDKMNLNNNADIIHYAVRKNLV